MENFGNYVIIARPTISYKEIAKICVKHDIKMLQLREKHLCDREILKIAKELREITLGTNTKLVIDDRPDIALLCQADYLHIGQSDISIKDARKIVGKMKIGLSTHSINQAKEALALKPDYIGFGPIYPTTTKAIADKPVGLANLKEVLKFAKVPVVALGGIFPKNINDVLNTGARNISMVRYLMNDNNDFEKKIIDINNLLYKICSYKK